MNEDLRQWLRQNWVDISRKKKGGGHPSCGASAGKGTRAKDSSKKYPKCVPASKAKSMSKKEKQSAVRRKRQKPNQPGKPDFVNTKLKKEELNLLEYQMKLDNLLEFLMEEKMSEQTAPPVGATPVNPPASAGTGTPAGVDLMMNPAVAAAVPAPPAGAVPPIGAAAMPAATGPTGTIGTTTQPRGSTAPALLATPAAEAVRTTPPQPVPGQPAPPVAAPPVAAPAGGLSPLPLAEDLSALTEEQLLEMLTSEELDPVGKEDKDVDNDGEENTASDEYLLHRREVRSRAIESSLSESIKYQELQNQERRRKSLIKVQNKIIYAKK